MKKKNNTNSPKSRGSRRRLVIAGLVATAASAGIIAANGRGLGDRWPHPQPAPIDQTVEVFAHIKPLDSITIPSTSCSTNYLLVDTDSRWAHRAAGVEIAGDSGWIGTTITHSAYRSHNPKGHRGVAAHGTDASKGASTATNWDHLHQP